LLLPLLRIRTWRSQVSPHRRRRRRRRRRRSRGLSI
jgi:hypothetical protein